MASARRKLSFLVDSPFVMVQKEVGQHEDQRKPLLKRLEKAFKAKVVCFFTSFKKRDVQITDDDAEMLESLLAVEHDKQKKLVLLINSPGGQALAAERIVNVCRSYSNNNFEVIVPHMAKSAATMICFGAKTIHMSPTAELGPVDPQVPFWTNQNQSDPPMWISAEEYIRSYDNLITASTEGTSKRLEPYLQQLNRYDARYVEKLRSVQKLSADISVRLLHSLMMKKKPTQHIEKSIEVFLSQTKTNSHGRMINLHEARRCGLSIAAIDLRSRVWHAVWELYVRFDWVVSNRCGKVIETTETSVQA